MAGPAPNQLIDLLHALRRRRYQVIVPAVLIASLGIAFAFIVPKRYKLSTRIAVRESVRAEPDYRLRNPQDTALRREVPSVEDHIVNFQRVKDVLDRNLQQWPEYRQAGSGFARDQFIRDRILDNLEALLRSKDPKGGTIFIDVTFSDEDRERAARFLGDLTESWLLEMFESDREMLLSEIKQLQEYLDVQISDLRDKEDRLFANIELLGQDPTVVQSGDDRRENPGDWTYRELGQARSELEDVEFELVTARFQLEQLEERLEATPARISEVVSIEADDPALQVTVLRTQLEALEDRLANKRPGHSDYRILQPKIDELVAALAELERTTPGAAERTVAKDNPELANLQLARLNKQEQVRVLEKQRDSLVQKVKQLGQDSQARVQHYKQQTELLNQVEQARLAVNETRQQWQTRDKSLQMLDSSERPWRIAQPPLPETAKTQPNPWILSGVSIVLGLAIGLGVALASELAKSSYRSVGDLAAVMSVPVLGAIDTIVTRDERRRMQVSHAMAGLSTAAIVGTICWITWLWHSSPERLPIEVQDAIERLRSALK
jgi:uncharacterized protein involved in exopolysaccharide biosynthesis